MNIHDDEVLQVYLSFNIQQGTYRPFTPMGTSAIPYHRGTTMIRVLLAEDQAMVRGALAALLSLEEDIAVVAEAARGDEVVPAALSTQPDVALVDIEMPDGDGLHAAKHSTSGCCPVES